MATLVGRFRIKTHAYALMPNHYHILLQTPEANLSQAIQWLNVSYGIWFNRKYRRVGPLFQGRFKAVLLEPDNALLAVSRYIHLNPVRTARFPDEPNVAMSSVTASTVIPATQRIHERIEFLRRFPWSSYAPVAGLRPAPVWLTVDGILSRTVAGPKKEQRAAYRQYVEEPIRKGEEDSILDQVLNSVALGSQEFLQRVKSLAKGEARNKVLFERSHTERSWETIKLAMSHAKGEPWEQFVNRHGDYARNIALLIARETGRLTLARLGQEVGISESAVAHAVRQAERLIRSDPSAMKLFRSITDYSSFKT